MVLGMLRSVTVTIAVLACVLAVVPTTTHALEIGDYFRPSSKESSAFAGTRAAYRRSPCPALNTLANHGYLPRDGKNITHAVLKEALMDVYNLAGSTAKFLVNQVPDPISLDYLGTHNLIEHDGSLAHADYYYGFDPMTVNTTLAEDLFSRADEEGMITTAAVAQTRKDRTELCKTENPDCSLNLHRMEFTFSEAAILILALGNGDAISEAHARSFILEERIPDDYAKPESAVSLPKVLVKSASIAIQSVL